ncbi:hypothetical protein RCL_jg13320.t1 [Rhizophagus clarus]|uniref:Uncharacterized protein n=1 Tax=Rhizophagus clarus TaxID=94130 RepID=A0A8H3QS63_9GLOM|nr:hypothetical protein RCL_jg13320.t1 [Rhizophagus clarus]
MFESFTPDGQTILQYTRASAWKTVRDKDGLKGILYFDAHERHMRALTLSTDRIRLTASSTPSPIRSKKKKINRLFEPQITFESPEQTGISGKIVRPLT